MKRNHAIAGLLLAATAGGLAQGLFTPPRADAQVRRAVLRIGLVATLYRGAPESVMGMMMRPFKSLMQAQTGMNGELVAGGDAYCLARKLKKNQVHLGVFHGVEFAWARQKYPTLKPLTIIVNRTRSLRALLVVRNDTRATCCGDLEGKVAALPRSNREHCRLFFERRCVKSGSEPASFFTQVTTPADAEDALDAVVDGKAHAAVVDAVALASYRKVKPGRARRLKTLLESEPFPCGVIAYQSGKLDARTVQRLRSGLITAKDNRRSKQIMEMLGLTAFENAPASYVRQLTAIARSFPPTATLK